MPVTQSCNTPAVPLLPPLLYARFPLEKTINWRKIFEPIKGGEAFAYLPSRSVKKCPAALNFLTFNCVVLRNNTVNPVFPYYCSISSLLCSLLCPPRKDKICHVANSFCLCIFMQCFCIFMQCKTLMSCCPVPVTTQKAFFYIQKLLNIFFSRTFVPYIPYILGLFSHISTISSYFDATNHNATYPAPISCIYSLLLPQYLVSFPFSVFSVLSLRRQHCFTLLSFFSFQNYTILLYCHTILSIIINSVYPFPLLS